MAEEEKEEDGGGSGGGGGSSGSVGCSRRGAEPRLTISRWIVRPMTCFIYCTSRMIGTASSRIAPKAIAYDHQLTSWSSQLTHSSVTLSRK